MFSCLHFIKKTIEGLRKLKILTETHNVAISTKLLAHLKHMHEIKHLNTTLNQCVPLNGLFQKPAKDMLWSIPMGHFITHFHVCLYVFLNELLL